MKLEEDAARLKQFKTIYKVLPLISLRNHVRLSYANIQSFCDANNMTYNHAEKMIGAGYKVQEDILYRPIRQLAATSEDVDYLLTMHPIYPELSEFKYPKIPKRKVGRPKGSLTLKKNALKTGPKKKPKNTDI